MQIYLFNLKQPNDIIKNALEIADNIYLFALNGPIKFLVLNIKIANLKS